MSKVARLRVMLFSSVFLLISCGAGGVAGDTTPPVITLNDASSITIVQGSNYIEAGATAVDDIDGNVSVDITGSIDTSTLDTYIIAYTSTDAAGNTSTITRTVNVVSDEDASPPIITLNGANPITVELGSNYAEAGATAVDDIDGDVSVVITGFVDTNILGTNTITYTATDAASNVSTVTRIINVISDATADTTPPVITLNGANDITIALGSS